MRIRRTALFLLACAGALTPVDFSQAQTPVPAPARPAQTVPKAAASAAAMQPKVYATLAQVMKGILYPASNVIFAAQDQNPADVKPAPDPSTATNPLASSYGKWEAIENSSLALSEAANLLILPGRKCSNGLAVPIRNADWPKLVQGLRDAGMVAYKAALTKNQDNIIEAADTMTTACANCHDKYREKPNLADRCK